MTHTEHQHYVVTCPECSATFSMCGLPCFIICPQCHIVLYINDGGNGP